MKIPPLPVLLALTLSACSSPAARPKPTDAVDPLATPKAPSTIASPMTTGATSLDATQRKLLEALGDLGEVSDACLTNERCALFGECSADVDDDQRCYARAPDCSKTAACALIGACAEAGLINGYDGVEGACMPTEDAHCRASLACANEGKCTAVSQWERFSCEVRLDSDCAATPACSSEGKCKALDGACVTEEAAAAFCAAQPACADGGIDCTPIDNRCRNPAGFDCAATPGCATHNTCASTTEDVGGGPFIACHLSVAYCEAQPACTGMGICGVSISSDHGNGHYKGDCALEGPTRCDEDFTRSECVKTESGCAASVRCTTHGECSAASPSGYCHPIEESHCLASMNCKEHGFCNLADESSYMVCSD